MFGIPLHIVLPTLIGSLIAGGICSVMGIFVVRMNLSSLGFAMSHAAFAGAALGIAVSGLDPLLMAILFAVAMAAVLGPLSELSRLNPDTIIGAIFPLMMALGLIFLSLAPSAGIGSGALSLLWGSVLGITMSDVIKLGILAVVLLFVLGVFWKEFLAVLLDRKLAAASGIPVRVYYYTILFLTALVVAFSLRITGGLLIYTLMILPASAAYQLLYDIKKVFLAAPLIGALSSLLGFILSLAADLPIGSSIAVAAAGIFLLAVVLSPKRRVAKGTQA
ncbi:MAG TPA: metal ABC transporter permease [Candidatus Acetothermia bacterium]|nr:metal ABC transporter permease [Candidatus Bipolaricaulota bacterium]HDJ30322.1 metal ABC transporter permease [Candidatus Acetothermia bacterium]